MLRNYLKIAYRNLRRQKGYAFINVAGLAVGLAVSFLIVHFVQYELSYDEFHEKADRIYRVLLSEEISGDVEVIMPEMLAPDLQAAFPEVASFARLMGPDENVLVSAGGKQLYQDGFLRAGPNFFEVFTFTPIAGDLSTALDRPGSVVLTAPAARKYFGSVDVVGRTLTAVMPYATDRQPVYTVTAVIEDVPGNSHLQFDVVMRRTSHGAQGWMRRTAKSYIVLRKGADVDALRRKLPAATQRIAAARSDEGVNVDNYGLMLQPLTGIHLQPDPGAAAGKSGPMQYLYLFSAAALLILLIACINYMNLATARSAQRTREVGVRKAVGAQRYEVAGQFLAEAVLTSLGALLLALVLVQALLPIFNRIAGTQISLSFVAAPGRLLVFAGVAVLAGIVAGSYPAIFLSRFDPAKVLKASSSNQTGGGLWMRRGLVVFQFAASAVLIIGAVAIYQQMEYIRTERLNANGEQIVVLDRDALGRRFDPFKRALLARPEIVHVAAGALPGAGAYASGTYTTDSTRTHLNIIPVGHDYLETLGIDLLAGRGFSRARDGEEAVIINEEAAAWQGMEDPVGQTFRDGRTVVGVVEDFHILPLYQEIDPLVMRLAPKWTRSVFVRLEAGAIAEGLAAVREVWNRFVPERPPHYSFLDDRLDEAYRAELRLGKTFGAFSLLAILIACLGLFGLAAFTAQRRTKEIGIRKVLGASIPGIVALLSKDFLKLIGVAFVIAAPVAYWMVDWWLQGFAYHFDLGPWLFVGVGLTVLVTALLAVSYQAVKAALADPVEALRYE